MASLGHALVLRPRSAGGWPDPLLTANLYCSGKLDELICGAIYPFLRSYRESDPESSAYLWVIRHGRRGEHLKIRIHGHITERAVLERSLTDAVTRFLEGLGGATEEASRRNSTDSAIDVEDEIEGLAPDRTLLWTTYRRSHVSLGSRPFHRHDAYTAVLTRGLALNTERVLEDLKPDASGSFPFSIRQRSLVRALVDGLTALGLASDEQRTYLAFHRDWLIRFSAGLEKTESQISVRDLFDRRCADMADSQKRLAQAFLQARDAVGLPAEGVADEFTKAWQRSVWELRQEVEPRVAEPEYQTDPYAPDPMFPPFFKLFHGLANQLGIRMLDEAFVHHLLCAALSTADGHAFVRERSR